jgi:hypothetical protein
VAVHACTHVGVLTDAFELGRVVEVRGADRFTVERKTEVRDRETERR